MQKRFWTRIRICMTWLINLGPIFARLDTAFRKRRMMVSEHGGIYIYIYTYICVKPLSRRIEEVWEWSWLVFSNLEANFNQSGNFRALSKNNEASTDHQDQDKFNKQKHNPKMKHQNTKKRNLILKFATPDRPPRRLLCYIYIVSLSMFCV